MFALKSVDFSSLHWDFMMGNLRKQVGSQPKPPLNNSPPQFPCCSQAWMCFNLLSLLDGAGFDFLPIHQYFGHVGGTVFGNSHRAVWPFSAAFIDWEYVRWMG